jgi:hypothetical protein
MRFFAVYRCNILLPFNSDRKGEARGNGLVRRIKRRVIK